MIVAELEILLIKNGSKTKNENKEKIIQLAFENNIPLDKTWSCYSGDSKPCGKCDSCRIRDAAYQKWLNNKNR